MCLEGLTTLPAGVLSLLIVAIRDIMTAIKLKKETVQIRVSLASYKTSSTIYNYERHDVTFLITRLIPGPSDGCNTDSVLLRYLPPLRYVIPHSARHRSGHSEKCLSLPSRGEHHIRGKIEKDEINV